MKAPFNYLDEEEKELMESVERGEWKRTANFDEEKKNRLISESKKFRTYLIGLKQRFQVIGKN